MNWNNPKPDLNIHKRPRRKSFNELLEELAERTGEQVIPVERRNSGAKDWTREIQ